ncbi:MAG TPA: response regulator transcription factor [Steroidobacteraceae bacterium]|nr:response regulator transcription factor [Gammaproteobacteria bacterium]HEV2286890.1 response regulator transcription factor [Steroidobacteraceae bacterium]
MTPVTVFVADDHAIVRDGLVAHLSAQADLAVVGTASNGRDAVREILAHAPRVAILDISMPELDGLEATRQILAGCPEVRVIVLSMHGGAQHIFRALEAGVRGYLLKESAGSEIIEAIRAVQSGRRYLSPRVAEIVAENLGTRGAVSPLESLSRREREILKLVADGHSSAAIGAKLHLSPKTIDSYRSRMMQKLHLGDLAGVIKFAIQHGLTSLE